MAQRPDETKRREILAAASRLFAQRPFHEVKLDEVAAEAGVGKGTVYCYFPSKDDLHLSLIESAFRTLIDEIEDALAAGSDSAWEQLRRVVVQLVLFGQKHPDMVQIMRTSCQSIEVKTRPLREQIAAMVRVVIEEGVASGELSDPCPRLTAHYILAFIRAARLYGPGGLADEAITEHFLHILSGGLRATHGLDAGGAAQGRER